jgi:hypothetical protein
MFEAKLVARRQKIPWSKIVCDGKCDRDFSSAASLPLIMMWSHDLLASLFTNDQKFK